MLKRLLLAVGVLFAGCTKTPVQQLVPSHDPVRPLQAEARTDGEPTQPAHVDFTITAVHEKQKPLAHAPFRASGGPWTFLDCRAARHPRITFTVGLREQIPARAVLAVQDGRSGSRFVTWFHTAFPGRLPKVLAQSHTPEALLIHALGLGEHMGRNPNGEFEGTEGSWTATKWFLEYDGRSAEVFFNYSLTERKGEFSEKDAGYRDDLLAILASALRDGTRPQRAPETDPNLTSVGPRLGKPRRLLSHLATRYAFSPKGRFAVCQDGTVIRAVRLGAHEARPFEIARFEHAPWDFRVLNEDLRLIVEEGIPQEPGVRNLGDNTCMWWVSPNQKRLLHGWEKDLDLAEAAVSPDYRFVAFERWYGNGERRTKFLNILDRTTGVMRTAASQGRPLSVVGWKRTEAGLRAVARMPRVRSDTKQQPESYLIEPVTGRMQRQYDEPALAGDELLSPDGKYRVQLDKDRLTVTTVASGQKRGFVFHGDNRRFLIDDCIEWVSPRYLRFNGPRLAFIDATTMKMSFASPAERTHQRPTAYKFSSDLRWVLYQEERIDGESLFLAPVESASGQRTEGK